MTYTRSQLRGLAYNKIPRLGFQRTADGVSTTLITDAVQFTGRPPTHYNGLQIYMPTAAATDQIRTAGLIDGATLANAGLAWGKPSTT